jgi:hypothetical protein
MPDTLRLLLIGGTMKKHFPIIIEQDKDGVFIVECPVLNSKEVSRLEL